MLVIHESFRNGQFCSHRFAQIFSQMTQIFQLLQVCFCSQSSVPADAADLYADAADLHADDADKLNQIFISAICEKIGGNRKAELTRSV